MGKPHNQTPRKSNKTTKPAGSDASNSSFDHPSTPAVFFFKDDEDPYGCFCQWYRSNFSDPESGLSFNSSVQWMMWNKAKTAGDKASMRAIMKTDSPKEQKQMGREVKDFEPAEWNKIKFAVVVRGNMMKFTQGNDQAYREVNSSGTEGDETALTARRDILLDTAGRYLVEASYFDRVWGIGYSAAEAKGMERTKWGENLLGKHCVS